MYSAELKAVERGISFTELMEKAGTACAEIIYDRFCRNNNNKVLVLCGKGKNGGEGFVIARVLAKLGVNADAALMCGYPSEGDQLINFKLFNESGGNIIDCTDNTDLFNNLIKDYDIIVDAVFGTGFRGSLNSFLSACADTVNSSGKTVVGVDVPSGVNCDTCEISGSVFKADLTIAISAYKPIHIIKPYCEICGETVIADISITDKDYSSNDNIQIITSEDADIKNILPERKSDSNKGSFGKAMCICGSYRMPGAAYMSVSGAMRLGAGLVTACFPESAYTPLSSKLTEAILMPVTANEAGTFSSSAYNEINEELGKSKSALIGCGIGVNPDTKTLTEEIIKNSAVPLVLDADALNAIADNPAILKEASCKIIITPHPGEMSRLCKKNIEDIVSDAVKTATEFSKEYRCTVILKGANTVVCSPERDYVFINKTGNTGLSKGGSGDLLAGMLVSLLAQGMEPFEASVVAVYLHGDCADKLCEKYSERSVLVTDLINYLPEYMKRYD